jgi:hypothetical protein
MEPPRRDVPLPWTERSALAFLCGSLSLQQLDTEDLVAILRQVPHVDPSSFPPSPRKWWDR